jgi:hypothetical protein
VHQVGHWLRLLYMSSVSLCEEGDCCHKREISLLIQTQLPGQCDDQSKPLFKNSVIVINCISCIIVAFCLLLYGIWVCCRVVLSLTITWIVPLIISSNTSQGKQNLGILFQTCLNGSHCSCFGCHPYNSVYLAKILIYTATQAISTENCICFLNHSSDRASSCNSGKWPTWRTVSSIIRLFESSSCFQQLCAHLQEDSCINIYLTKSIGAVNINTAWIIFSC